MESDKETGEKAAEKPVLNAMHNFIIKVFDDFDLPSMQIGIKKRVKKTRNVRCIKSFRRRMCVLYFALHLHHESAIEDFLDNFLISRQYMICLIGSHCYHVHKHNDDDVYLNFIYSCVFIYQVSRIAAENRRPEFIELAPLLACDLYDARFREVFEALGGFDKYRDYLEDDSGVLDLITFIKLYLVLPRYHMSIIILDYVTDNPLTFQFGTKSTECHAELVKRVSEFRNYILENFEVEDNNIQFRDNITYYIAILEIELRQTLKEKNRCPDYRLKGPTSGR